MVVLGTYIRTSRLGFGLVLGLVWFWIWWGVVSWLLLHTHVFFLA